MPGRTTVHKLARSCSARISGPALASSAGVKPRKVSAPKKWACQRVLSRTAGSAAIAASTAARPAYSAPSSASAVGARPTARWSAARTRA